MGGAWLRELVKEVGPELNEDVLTSLAVKGVQDQLGVVGAPSRSAAKVHKVRCLPQVPSSTPLFIQGWWRIVATEGSSGDPCTAWWQVR